MGFHVRNSRNFCPTLPHIKLPARFANVPLPLSYTHSQSSCSIDHILAAEELRSATDDETVSLSISRLNFIFISGLSVARLPSVRPSSRRKRSVSMSLSVGCWILGKRRDGSWFFLAFFSLVFPPGVWVG